MSTLRIKTLCHETSASSWAVLVSHCRAKTLLHADVFSGCWTPADVSPIVLMMLLDRSEDIASARNLRKGSEVMHTVRFYGFIKEWPSAWTRAESGCSKWRVLFCWALSCKWWCSCSDGLFSNSGEIIDVHNRVRSLMEEGAEGKHRGGGRLSSSLNTASLRSWWKMVWAPLLHLKGDGETMTWGMTL